MKIEDARLAASKAEGVVDKALVWLTALPPPFTLLAVVGVLVLAAFVGYSLK